MARCKTSLSKNSLSGAPRKANRPPCRGITNTQTTCTRFALPEDGASIAGQVLYVTPDELALLDVYEGDAYERVRVTLDNGQDVYVYRGNPTDE